VPTHAAICATTAFNGMTAFLLLLLLLLLLQALP
jgi:hypothetical protein